MEPAPAHVLLLRSGSGPDRYEEAFAAAGYETTTVPVLAFTFVHQDALRRRLERPHSYGGLVLTSPRAVEALADVLQWLPSETAAWHTRPAFAVGPATAAELRAIGFEPEGEDSGSAALLADHVADRSLAAPLLFLCGSRRRDALPDGLGAAGIRFDELCVYETHLRDPLDLTAVPAPRWAVFFSPSGVEAAQSATGIDWAGVRKAAIGETTAGALAAQGWRPDAVAAEPSPEAIVAAVAGADGCSHAL